MSKQTLKDQVEFILTTVPESRNSDITLTIELWKYYYPQSVHRGEKTGKYYILIDKLFDLPREDNIKRIRAEIQNVEHRYLPTEVAILIERARMSKEWREFLGYNPLTPIEQLDAKITEWWNGQRNQQTLF
mgnify:CR=1 FL=1